MNIRLASVSTFAAIHLLAAQNAPDQLKFEVASVKRAERCDFKASIDPASISFKGMPLKPILMEAFKVRMDQIQGPSWLESDCFDIAAKMPEGATREQLPALLQALLVERFKLVARKESHLRPGYVMVIDKDGPKIKPSSTDFVRGRKDLLFIGRGPGYAAFKGSMTMTSLARSLSTRLDGQVQDLTGLEGKYDVDIAWLPDPTTDPSGVADPSAEERMRSLPNPPTTDIYHAIRESLGLRLEPRKQQVDLVVIDRIERVPTEN
jgi:uncharacterized protein (TIGR03435 family)